MLETCIQASPSTWQALKFACENDDLVATLPVLHAAGIKLLNKTIQMSYDDRNFRYDLPIFVINDPSSFIETKDVTEFETKNVKVVFVVDHSSL